MHHNKKIWIIVGLLLVALVIVFVRRQLNNPTNQNIVDDQRYTTNVSDVERVSFLTFDETEEMSTSTFIAAYIDKYGSIALYKESVILSPDKKFVKYVVGLGDDIGVYVYDIVNDQNNELSNIKSAYGRDAVWLDDGRLEASGVLSECQNLECPSQTYYSINSRTPWIFVEASE